jgi:metal-sulfur cluster biosynthetic enzyme
MVSEKQVWEVLKTVFDPEIPINIVDLGLVYNVAVADKSVHVDMTMTVRGCPMHQYITKDAEDKLSKVPGIDKATVRLVWDPPWNQSMISENGWTTLRQR